MKYLLFIPLLLLLWIVIDVFRTLFKKKAPDLPDPDPDTLEEVILAKLHKGEEIPDDEFMPKLESAFDYINSRYDCADFKVNGLIRMYLQYGDKLPLPVKERIRSTLLNFRYSMEQPGKDSMCFWSENHQLLFGVAEYLAGQTFPDEVFKVDGKSGKEHKQMAEARIKDWMELRFQYGFSEWYSNVYYVEDLAAMSNFAELAQDEKLRLKMKMIMDILWFDVATHSLKGAFVSTGGRMYTTHKISSDKGNSLRDAITWLWPEYDVGNPDTNHSMLINFLINTEYKLPDAIRNIMLDENYQIILASNGVSVSEMKDENLIGQANKQIFMQLGKEAYTNPELIENTVKYLAKNKMFNNCFVNPIGFFNISLFKIFHLLAPLSRLIKSPSDTVALDRSNVYTYRTKDYIMATAQQYGVNTCAYQQHIFSVTMHRSFSMFTTWPAKQSDGGAPSFIIGSFRLPHAFQHKNIAVMLYDLTIKKHLERKPLDYTHAFFPTELMDEHIIEGNFAFCRKGKAYAAIAGASKLELGPMREERFGNYGLTKQYELRQYGDRQYWIFELSSESEDESFENFIRRVKANSVSFDTDVQKLSYSSKGDEITVIYNEKVMVNGQAVNTEYKRFDSAYSVTDRKAEEIRIACNGAKLILNQNKLIREEIIEPSVTTG